MSYHDDDEAIDICEADTDSEFDSLRDEFAGTIPADERASMSGAEFWRRFREWDQRRRSRTDRRADHLFREQLNAYERAVREPFIRLLRSGEEERERLTKENRALRKIVQEQQRVLDVAQPDYAALRRAADECERIARN